jgi:uncharacterized protein YmfQ (DUF2313 family)
MGLTLETYQNILKKLLPDGKIWRFSSASDFIKFLNSFAVELLRIENKGYDLFRDALPDTTVDLLSDWERITALPDTSNPQTDEQRRANIVAKLRFNETGKQVLIDLAAEIGYVITITEFQQFRASISKAGDALTNGEWVFTFQVNYSGTLSELQELVEKVKTAHTFAIYNLV